MSNQVVTVNQDRLIQEFLELVQIYSPSRREREVSLVIVDKLTALGLEVYEDSAGAAIGSGSGNIIARLPATAGQTKPAIFFSAHLDTVEPGENVQPVLAEGIISSRGETILGGDDKAGIAAILEALRLVKELGIAHGELEVVLTVCEEVGLLGAANLEYQRLNSRMGFILDAAGPVGTIIVQGPAQIRLEAGIIGKAAHAGVCPEEGISAIQVAAQAISQMKLGRIDAETTANIGLIEGGKAINIVPELVNLKGEARSLKPAKLEAQTKHMVDTLEQVAKAAGAKAQVRTEQIYAQIDLAPDSPAVLAAVKAAENLGIPAKLEATGGGSDANIFCGQGLAAVNLGIGMNNVHTTQETMAVADLMNTVRYLVEIIKVVE
ncbi:MAG: M20/M25/M40 family metallo-hydrolase [Carboxydocellales bacterium]